MYHSHYYVETTGDGEILKRILARAMSAPLDSLDKADKVRTALDGGHRAHKSYLQAVFLSVLALAAQSSNHPAITGEKAPSLEVRRRDKLRVLELTYCAAVC